MVRHLKARYHLALCQTDEFMDQRGCKNPKAQRSQSGDRQLLPRVGSRLRHVGHDHVCVSLTRHRKGLWILGDSRVVKKAARAPAPPRNDERGNRATVSDSHDRAEVRDIDVLKKLFKLSQRCPRSFDLRSRPCQYLRHLDSVHHSSLWHFLEPWHQVPRPLRPPLHSRYLALLAGRRRRLSQVDCLPSM